ncbi:amino acid adenylation domain-containing protein, partial [Duganella sp. CT11-25]
RGHLDAGALRAALTRIVARHEVLRTRFVEQAGLPAQQIDAPAAFALAVSDLRALAGHEQASAVERYSVDEASAPFDLARGPLIRGQLLRLAEEEHVLLLTQHHIVSDGWSVGLLVEEVRTLYTAFSQGQADPLPPLAVQYADYAQWQRGWLQGELLERQLAFWRGHLGGAPSLLELPLDRPRPAQQSYAGGALPVRLPAALADGLRQLARREGTTLFMTLLAGWSVLLSRLSGQGEVVTGTPVANRQRGDVANLIGFFVNTLALRVTLEDDPTVAQLLARVKADTLEAYSHQDVPFEQVVEALKPPRSTSHSPVFQVMLSLNNTPDRSLTLPGLTLDILAQQRGSAQFELNLALEEQDGSLHGWLTYASTLFDASTVARFIQYFETILAGMVADAQQAVSRLPLLDPAGLAQLAGFNATAHPYPSRLVHELFEEQVARDGAAMALVCGAERLSYAQLNQRANRLAHHLRALGIGPDERVAICVERSVEMVVGLLAILKAGGAYVPLDPDYPAERLAYMLADSAPRALLTHSALRERLDAGALPVLELDRLEAALAGLPDVNPERGALRPDHLAYVIYTSGSTGQPKGVMNQHDGVVNRLLWAQDTYQLTARDRVLQKTPMAFDVSVWEFLLPLLAGAQLVMARPQGHQDPQYLAEAIETAGITMLHFVPSMLQLFLPQADARRCASLRRVLCSGEALPAALQKHFHRSLPDVELHNLYGPTEAAVDVTAWHCLPGQAGSSVPIGRPIANTAMYVLDRQGQPVPVGVAGELYIGGVQVARGYLNRHELTAERFVPDPFSGVPRARMYKTGDVGRWREDGAIEYLGRNDFQVKLRGQRIELGEIEARLAACDGVGEAVVVALGEGGDMRLVAYLVPATGAQLEAAALRAALARQVAEYMIPGAFVMLEALPLTPNGKLDRKALPAPDASALAVREYAPPQGAAEEAIAAIWQELLGVEQVGRHDHFFELGGHSLMVIGMLERLRQRGWHGDVRGVFGAPTLAELAAGLVTAGGAAAFEVPLNGIPAGATAITPEMLSLVALTPAQIEQVAASVPGGVANIQDIYPLAPLQAGILFHHLLGGEGDAYLMRSVLSFDTAARMAAFLDALQRVIDRHDILRSAVRWQGLPQPVQVVHRAAPLTIERLDGGADALERLMVQTDTRQLRLDLQRAPLLSAWAVQAPDSEVCHLALLTHHLVCDHVTLEVVIGEIGMLLAGRGAALPPALPYRNFVAQTLAVDPAVHEAYFRAQLGDVDEPTAPFGLFDVRGDGQHVDEVRIGLDGNVSSSIRALARQHRVSPAVLFHVAWALVVARCSDRREAVFGTVLSGRLQGTSGADRVLGMFINTLPVRIKLEGVSVGEVVAAVYAQLGELLEHEQAPLALAQRCSGVAAPAPLFTSLLNYRHSRSNDQDPQAALAWVGIEAGPGEERTNYPLTLSVDDLGQAFAITAQCDGVSAARVADLLAHAVEQFVLALQLRPEAQLSSLAILPAAERHQLLEQFQGAPRAYPASLVHELFEQQVARDGAATALVCGAERLSYAQLNQRANRLAHHLRALGIGPDERVAICVERSVEMVVGLLAILKAGGAYVPLDPDYPGERLAYMLADSAPRALLTHSALRERLDAGAVPVLELDRLEAALAGLPDTNPERGALRPDHLAYVIYTSGSTGQPKGVMNQHDGVVNRLLWGQDTYQLTARDRVLQKTPMAFDVSVWEFFLPLLAGAQLVMARPQGHLDPQYLAEAIEAAGITMMHFVPSMLQLFLPQADARRCASLRRVLCSGEALPAALQQHFHRSLPDVELHNLYGPTEAAVEVTAWHCLPGQGGSSVPIGRPIANTAMYVLDRQGQPVPVGVAGELYIGGVQVARGYLNRHELTAERFVPDSFSGVPRARMYKTGDVGRWREDGAIEYLGRNDFQVKLRGQRIELGEIEARLVACDGVGEAVVVARGEGGDMRLVAYLVPAAGAQLEAAALRAALARQVAEYMIPGAFVMLEALPLTPNGKLDRKALPAPDASALAAREYVPPQGVVEKAIATIWRELLGVEQVGRHDHFFELGGHSLMLISMLERLRQQGWHGDVRGVFAAPTLAALAARLVTTGGAVAVEVPPNGIPAGATQITPEMLPLVALTPAQIEQVAASVPGGAANIQDIYPLAPLQAGILFHHLLGGEGDAYLLRSTLSFDTAARMGAFLAALQQVIDRHDILRSAVHWQGLPQPVQVVHRVARLPVTRLPTDGNTPAREQLLAQADPRRLRLDLQRAPLLSAWTVQAPDSEVCHLALLTHHLVCDHVTLEVVIGEIGMLLAGRGAALPSALPYRNFVAQTLAVDPAVHEAYFRAQLGDVDEPTAPFGLFDVRGDGQHVDEVRIGLDGNMSSSIRALARQHRVSPAVLFHVAWALVVAQCSDRREAVFGTVLSGRLQGTSGADRVLGMFINTLPVRIRLEGVGVGESVAAVYAQLSELVAHEQAPLALAQRCSGVAAPVPLFTSLLNYRHSGDNTQDPQAASAWAGIEAAPDEERTNYPLTLSVDDLGQAFAITAQCVGVSAARVADLLAHAVEQFVLALQLRPEAQLSSLAILPAAERHQLLEQFQGAPRAYPASLVHELFEQQVARDGAATALVCGAERLSYAQLNQRANRLAHHLRALGIGPDERVAICVERSVEMVVGLLAILKAGGAYVPLDPDYPAERLAYMLADSAPRALLTHSALRDRLAAGAVPVLELDGLEAALAGLPDTNPERGALRPDHLAYVIYTSGSTGQPKGAMNQHDGVVNRLLWAQDTYQLTARDRVLQKTPMAFDVSVWEFFLPLLAGAQLVMARPQGHQDPQYLAEAIETAGITMLHFVPSMLQLFLPQADARRCASLRRVLCSGEALPAALQQHFHRSLPDVELHNLYGPTEAAVDVTAWHCLPGQAGSSVPIGRPIANTAMYVLDRQGQPVPVGVAGELYIGGVQVARGYLNRHELTAERFVPDPFSGVPRARMYKTGDVGRWREDGAIEYLGRNDFQVKLRGQRIELGEIEARLMACEGVGEAVVVARGEGGDMRLVAYLVPAAGAQLEAAALRAALARQVAEYMIPGAFVMLEALPLTPNGKLDRKALPAPDASALAAREYVPPQGVVEKAIAAIWQDLLGVEKVGRHDNFFELGGHSLLAIQLLSLLRGQFGVELTIHELFHQATVDAIGMVISDKQLAQFAAADIEVLSKDIDELPEAELMQLLEEERRLAATN